jgi:predicted RNase H-like HicB family nuclease
MLTYKAAYKYVPGGVHAHVLDFPGAISSGADLDDARRMIASALLDLAELALERGESLPIPDPTSTDPDADIEEPLHLHLCASTGVDLVPAGGCGAMNRQDLLRHLRTHGCVLAREGAAHSIWENPVNNRRSAVPATARFRNTLPGRFVDNSVLPNH